MTEAVDQGTQKSGLSPGPFVSYAQNFEDVMLWRALKHVSQGFYVDVGAQDPDDFSVTKAFYERGWRGINIEPVSQWFEKLANSRPADTNLQLAAGAQNGEALIYEIPNTGLSTFDRGIAERHRRELGYEFVERRVQVARMTDLCGAHCRGPIHFLKIDVEGAERQVLEGLDLTTIRPWIILLEATSPMLHRACHGDWEPMLLRAGYEFVYFDALNRFYLASEHAVTLRDAFAVPPNVFDGFVPASDVVAKKAKVALERACEAAESAKTALERSNERLREAEKLERDMLARIQAAERRARHAEERLAAVERSRSRPITAGLSWVRAYAVAGRKRIAQKRGYLAAVSARIVRRLLLIAKRSPLFGRLAPWARERYPGLWARARLLLLHNPVAMRAAASTAAAVPDTVPASSTPLEQRLPISDIDAIEWKITADELVRLIEQEMLRQQDSARL